MAFWGRRWDEKGKTKGEQQQSCRCLVAAVRVGVVVVVDLDLDLDLFKLLAGAAAPGPRRPPQKGLVAGDDEDGDCVCSFSFVPTSEAARDHNKKTKEEEKKPKESTSSSSFSLWPPRFPSSLPSLPSLPLLVSLSSPGGDPDKGRLLSVADFFDHARDNSKKLWAELDGDGDGWATEGDVARALAARGLPTSYAPRVVAAARGRARWWATRVSRREFASWMQRGEPRALRAFTSMALDRSGKVDVRGIKDVLKRSGVVRR